MRARSHARTLYARACLLVAPFVCALDKLNVFTMCAGFCLPVMPMTRVHLAWGQTPRSWSRTLKGKDRSSSCLRRSSLHFCDMRMLSLHGHRWRCTLCPRSSTSLWEELDPSVMELAGRLHDTTIRKLITKHKG